MLLRLFFSLILLILCTSCNFPRDAQQTLENISGGTIRVGIVENQPWVKRVNGKPAGIEVNLVNQFAQELKAKVNWIWGDEENHLEALKEHELDVVIAGLTKSTPWQDEVGLTNPYYTENILVGVPPSQSLINSIRNTEVAAKQGEAFIGDLKKKKAIPVRVKQPFEVNKPVVAPEWQLKNRGFQLTEIKLHENEYVIAVQPGENGFLMRLETFLNKQTSEVNKMLQKEDTQS